MKTSLMKSLQKSTPKTYMICLHSNFARQLHIQLKLRGLSAKLHHMNFEKGSDDETIITMQLLVQNYPKTIYGMGNLKLNQLTKKTKKKKKEGLICKMATLQLLEGFRCKNGPHHVGQ